MNRVVPLHSLVLVFSPSPRERAAEIGSIFPEHEIISAETVKLGLVGPAARPELGGIVAAELRRQVALKLSLGERVVVPGPHLRAEQRLALSNTARLQGAPVTYLITDPDDPRLRSDAGLRTGDGYAEVARLGRDRLLPVLSLPASPLTTLRSRYRGITVAGDVHGNLRALLAVAAWAKSRNHFLWLLGDVIDYGADTLEALNVVYGLVMRGEAATLLGNHERKIARWFQCQDDGTLSSLRLSDGNRVTTDALGRLGHAGRMAWFGRFRGVLARCSLITHLGDITLTHAAIHPDIWQGSSPHNPASNPEIENFALYGEADASPIYRLSHRWVDAVPAGKLVIVGHDTRSTVPLTVRGTLGGRVIFLDTGSSKGGALSSADLRFAPDGRLMLECFNRFD